MAKGLAAIGMKVRESVSLCESTRELTQAVSAALSRSNIIAVIGGVDGQSDYMAKNIISMGLGLPLETHAGCLNALREYCVRTGEEFRPEDEKLALLPRGAKPIYPSFGKVPGFIISSASQHILVLPEAQQELASMLGKHIVPFLNGVESSSAVTHVIRAYGVKEGYVRDKLSELLKAPNPAVTLQPEGNEMLIRVSSYAQNGRDAASLCEPVLKEIARRMGDTAYGLDVDSIQSAAVGKMIKKDLGLAIAEAGTMGMLTRVIGETVGGQEILRYSTVAEDEEAKSSKLDASLKLLKKRGNVSEYAAVAMAAGARNKSGTSIGVGIAANTSDFEDKKSFPGLVYIAVCDRENVYVKKLVVGDGGAPDDIIIDAAVSRALNMLRLFVDYLPGVYKGCVNLADALSGKMEVTGRDSYDDDINDADAIQKNGGSKRKVKKIVLVIAILVFLGCGGYLGVYYYQSNSARQQAETLQGLYDYGDLDNVEVNPDFPSAYLDSFGPLWTINSDIAGYISVEGTQVSYPVVQGEDNDFYLRRDFYKNKNNHGIPFVDYRVDMERPSENIVIYGHNMKDGQIFGELLGYKTLDYYKQHPTINFDTLYKHGEYRVYSVFITNVHESQGPVFPYHDFINSASDEDFKNYVKQIKVRSIIDTGVDVVPGDEMICISTCTYEFDDARLVIAARKLREGEDPRDGADAAVMNREPLYPDIWYNTFGGERPDGIEDGATVVTRPMKNEPNPSSWLIPENLTTEISEADESSGLEPESPIISSKSVSAAPELPLPTAQEIAASRAASDKAASESEAQRLAEISKEEPEKAASEQRLAASSKAAVEAMQLESQAASRAASSKAIVSAAEADAATAASGALSAARDAESAAAQVMDASFSEQAQSDLEFVWDAVTMAKAYAGDAMDAAERAGTETAKKSVSSAESSVAKAEKAFSEAERYYIELKDLEKAETAAAESKIAVSSGAHTASSATGETSGQGASSSDSGGGAHAAGKLTVVSGGKTITGDALDIISRIVQNEVGSGFHPEAIKAQAVASYSFISFHSRNGGAPSVYMSAKADPKVVNAVSEVIGQAVYYNGKIAFTPYYATSAGATTTSASVWGGSYPYLVSVDSSVDSSVSGYKYSVSFTRDKVESLLSSKLGVTADGDPSGWFEVISENDGGYNGDMAVCGYTKSASGTRLTGRLLREQVFNLRSACFTVDYDSSGDKFIFITYGYGHGVGMSQNGANLYASREGWSYVDILGHYYPGTSVR